MKKYLVLSLLSILALASCGEKTSSPSLTTSPLTPSTPSSTSSTSSPQVTSKDSSVKKEFTLSEAMVSSLKEGYALDGVLKAEYEGLKTVKNAVEIHSNSDYYQFHEFEGVEYLTDEKEKTPTKEIAGYTFNYSHKVFEATKEDIIYNSYLTINNEVKEEPVLVDDLPLLWETAGFSNAFNAVSLQDFTKENDQGLYSLDLNREDDLSLSLGTQIFGGPGLEAENVTFTTDGNSLTDIHVVFKTYVDSETSVNVKYTFDGKITALGAQASSALTPLAKAPHEVLTNALEILRTKDYHVTSTVQTSSYGIIKYEGYANYSHKYYAYTTDSEEGQYADIYFEKDGKVHSGLKIKDNYYEDRIPFDYSWEEAKILPSFALASSFFKEEKTSSSTFVYTLDKSIALRPTLSNVFSPFTTENIGDLKIEIKLDSKGTITDVVFDNHKDDETSELARYDGFGDKSKLIDTSKIKDDVSDLKWSEILSATNTQASLEKIYKVVPKEVIDTVPTIGGHTASITPSEGLPGSIDLVYQKGQSIEEVEALSKAYQEKLTKAGYTKITTDETATLITFTKDISVNNVAKVLNVSVEPVDYSFTGTPAYFLYVTLSLSDKS